MKQYNMWLYEKWIEHCEEILSYTSKMPTYFAQEYFDTYKWWLEQEYNRVVKQETEDGDSTN